MESHPPERRPSSLELSRRRDARILWLLADHPVTAAHLVELGWFPGRGKAQARLRRLAKKGRIHLVGTLSRRGGRPEHVYCRWRPRPEALQHEVELTDVCLRIDAREVRRGPAVLDRHVLPDAEVVLGGETFYLELDRGSMGHAQLARRFRLYEGCPHFSLWVCPSAERRDALRCRAERLRATALFATHQDVLREPGGAVWVDVGGGRVALGQAAAPGDAFRPAGGTDGGPPPSTRGAPSPRWGTDG